MRTFKLIEEYYGSPKLGTVIREDSLGQLVSEQIEIFNLDEILKFPKHWEEFEEVDYTGTRFYYNKWPVIEYEITNKDFEKYIIKFGNSTTHCKVPEVHEYFQNGEYVKIEEPKYVIGFDPACEDGDYCVIFKIKDGVAEVIKQEKIKEPFQRYLIDEYVLESIIEDLKKPIFVTEDGINLYDINDDCWWVSLKDYRYGKQPFIHENMSQHDTFKYFSTKEKAWLYLNKIRLQNNH